jgi:hypothetical protein
MFLDGWMEMLFLGLLTAIKNVMIKMKKNW